MAGRPLSSKAVRFLAVGLVNTAIDFSIFALLLAVGLPALASNALSWLVAVLFSYAANAQWSFERQRRHRDALPRFMLSGAAISLVVSTLTVGLLSGLVGLWPAKIGGTILAAILNFVAARWSIEDKLGR